MINHEYINWWCHVRAYNLKDAGIYWPGRVQQRDYIEQHCGKCIVWQFSPIPGTKIHHILSSVTAILTVLSIPTLWSLASIEFLALLPDQMNVQDHMSSDSAGQRRGLDDLALLRQKHVAFVSCNNCYAYLLMLVIHGNEVALWKKNTHTVTTIILSQKITYFFNELKCTAILSLWPHLLH